MPEVGDRVQVHSTKGDWAPRVGVVTGVTGSLLRIRWSTGEESTMIPGPGALAVIGKVRKPASKKAAAPTPAKKAAKAAKTRKKAPK
jgi:uncharacterized protein DUF1918